MNTPENTTTTIDGKPVAPEQEGPAPISAEELAAKLQAEMDRQRDQSLRDRADLENTRKRLEREKDDFRKYATSGLLEKLLPIVDNFEMGMIMARQSPGAESVVLGMTMVQKQLESFLSENGMQTIDAVGQKFDPNLHEALGEEANAEVPEGQVIRQQRKGYKLKDRLLRPASVFVSKGPA